MSGSARALASGIDSIPGISLDELELATRNHGFPLELLREPITPLGLHYLLIHFDIPEVTAKRGASASAATSSGPWSSRSRSSRHARRRRTL